jgi:hypothetical protein
MVERDWFAKKKYQVLRVGTSRTLGGSYSVVMFKMPMSSDVITSVTIMKHQSDWFNSNPIYPPHPTNQQAKHMRRCFLYPTKSTTPLPFNRYSNIESITRRRANKCHHFHQNKN